MKNILMGGVGFDWFEYTVFGAMMSMSALIGVYFGFFKKGQDSVDQYLLGGKNLGLLPISASLVCSYISGVTLLGIPTEVYTYGIQYLASGFGFLIMGLFIAFIMLPVLHKLQLVSFYQYLEMRFDASVLKAVSFIYTIYLLFHIPIVIYGPGLTLNQVTGLSVLGLTTLVSVICIFYTTIGGLRAVVWADTLQGVVMVGSCLGICIAGTIHVGGLREMLDAVQEGQRLEFFNLNPDPRIRTSWWSMTIGCSFIYASTIAVDPSNLQRFTALSTLRRAQWATFWFTLGALFFFLSSGYMGMVLYAAYQGCDPLLNGEISRPDQILPHFVATALRRVPGLPGTYIAGIVSAALSSMSTAINTVGGTMYSDFIEPMFGKRSERAAGLIIRTVSVVFGFACIALVIIVDKMGSIIELSFSIYGLSTGAILGVIILGMFFPQANSKGATAGGLTSMAVMMWILLKSKSALQAGEIVYERKPISVAECFSNGSQPINSTLATPVFGEVFPLYEISIYYFALLDCFLTVLVGLVVSYATGCGPAPNPDLLSPLVHRFLPGYSAVPAREEELRTIEEDRQPDPNSACNSIPSRANCSNCQAPDK